MKRFQYTGMWTMLHDPNCAACGSAEAAAALNEFKTELIDYCREEDDLAERTRTLRFTQTELAVSRGIVDEPPVKASFNGRRF